LPLSEPELNQTQVKWRVLINDNKLKNKVFLKYYHATVLAAWLKKSCDFNILKLSEVLTRKK
jgi:hypothetical protein